MTDETMFYNGISLTGTMYRQVCFGSTVFPAPNEMLHLVKYKSTSAAITKTFHGMLFKFVGKSKRTKGESPNLMQTLCNRVSKEQLAHNKITIYYKQLFRYTWKYIVLGSGTVFRLPSRFLWTNI